MKKLLLLFAMLCGLSSIALSQNNVIYYTSIYGEVVRPYDTSVFGASIVSNTYKNGKGVITFDNNVTEIGNEAFSWCRSLTSITIPESVTEIGKEAFGGCKSLKIITIPDGVTKIGERAFVGCESLAKFNGKLASEDGRCLFINGVLKAFAPAGLTEYSIPESVTEIGEYAFRWCNNLKSITIPNSVTKIGESAFRWCESLRSVYCKPTIPPTGGYDMFSNNASGRIIYVPRGSVQAYKRDWSDYTYSIVGFDF